MTNVNPSNPPVQLSEVEATVLPALRQLARRWQPWQRLSTDTITRVNPVRRVDGILVHGVVELDDLRVAFSLRRSRRPLMSLLYEGLDGSNPLWRGDTEFRAGQHKLFRQARASVRETGYFRIARQNQPPRTDQQPG